MPVLVNKSTAIEEMKLADSALVFNAILLELEERYHDAANDHFDETKKMWSGIVYWLFLDFQLVHHRDFAANKLSLIITNYIHMSSVTDILESMTAVAKYRCSLAKKYLNDIQDNNLPKLQEAKNMYYQASCLYKDYVDLSNKCTGRWRPVLPNKSTDSNTRNIYVPGSYSQSNTQDNTQYNTQSNIKSSERSNMQSNIKSSERSNIQPNMQSNIRSNIQPNMQSNMRYNERSTKKMWIAGKRNFD